MFYDLHIYCAVVHQNHSADTWNLISFIQPLSLCHYLATHLSAWFVHDNGALLIYLLTYFKRQISSYATAPTQSLRISMKTITTNALIDSSSLINMKQWKTGLNGWRRVIDVAISKHRNEQSLLLFRKSGNNAEDKSEHAEHTKNDTR